MPIWVQIAFGGAVLCVCAVLHIALLVRISRRYRVGPVKGPQPVRSQFRDIVRLFLLIVLSHTAQIGIWAAALLVVGALPAVENAVYFAMVTYTGLGYGDILLGPEHRTFGAMAAMTGILCFGLSTALLVGYFAGFMASPDE